MKKAAIETLTLKPSEVAQAIRILSKTNVALFIWGPPGISKSAVMRQVAAEQGRPFIDVRLSQMEPTDLRGIPYPTEENGVKGMRWSPPLVLPQDPDSNAFIALEEFNSAPQTVQAAAYQLVLDRALGEYKVPKNCVIVAAGNRDTDKGITFKMPTPIANRFTHIEMRVDFDDWQTWAVGSRVHQDVVGYLTAFKSDLFVFEPTSASRGFPTPRSWEFVSKILHVDTQASEIVTLGLLSGAVGDGIGIKFLTYRKHAADLPDTRAVLRGEIKKLTKKPEVSLCYALTTALCYELSEEARAIEQAGRQPEEREKWLRKADNFLHFMMNNFTAEVCIMGFKMAMSQHKLPLDVKRASFESFIDQYHDVIV